MNARRRLAALAGLTVVVAAAAWWQLWDEPAKPDTSEAVDSAAVARLSAAAVAARVAAGVPLVELALLGQLPVEPIDTGRDPFRFGAGRRAVAPADARPPDQVRTAPGRGTAPASLSPGGAQAVPPPPPIPLKFIGLVQKQGEHVRIAVLSDGRGVYHGREGDVIEGRYRILRISDNSVELAYLDGRGRQVILLSGA